MKRFEIVDTATSSVTNSAGVASEGSFYAFLIPCFLFMTVLVIVGCNAVKQVLKDPAKVEKVGREWEKQNPCTNDSITVSKSDTLIHYDTTMTFYTDTVYKDGKETVVLKSVPQLITKTITVHDTTNNYIVDNRRLNIANDSVNYYKGQSSFKQAAIDELKETVKDEHSRGNKWKLYFYLLLFGSIGLIVLYKWLKARFTLLF